MKRLILVILPLTIFLIWVITTGLKLVDPLFLSSPWSVLNSLYQGVKSGSLIHNLIATILRSLIGFVLAAVIGVPAGLLIGIVIRLLLGAVCGYNWACGCCWGQRNCSSR